MLLHITISPISGLQFTNMNVTDMVGTEYRYGDNVTEKANRLPTSFLRLVTLMNPRGVLDSNQSGWPTD